MDVLIVDDEHISLESMNDAVALMGHTPYTCDGSLKALELCRQRFFPCLLMDIRMPDMDGLELLQQIKQDSLCTSSDVIMVTGHGDLDSAITALRAGAYDFLKKPLDVRELGAVLNRSAEHQSLLKENRDLTHHFQDRVNAATEDIRRDLDRALEMARRAAGLPELVIHSPAMRQAADLALAMSKDPLIPVLIEGETGTGKEILARLIHFGRQGTSETFIDLNCAAIAENLFESELFGYAPGAFTGGSPRGGRGKLGLAGTGTLLLDEVGDLPLPLQPKLLRVIEERSYFRVGGLRKRLFQAQLICATNADLASMVEQGSFRRDLLHRIQVGHIRIPPLRQRKEDILAMAAHFLDRESRKRNRSFTAISDRAKDLLLAHPWPGNVRELEHAIERVVLLHDSHSLLPGHLDFLSCTEHSPQKPPAQAAPATDKGEDPVLPEESFDLDTWLDTTSRRVVERVLDRFDGNKTKAAAYLGWDRNRIYRLLGKD